MTDYEIRREALKLALEAPGNHELSMATILRMATDFFYFLKEGKDILDANPR